MCEAVLLKFKEKTPSNCSDSEIRYEIIDDIIVQLLLIPKSNDYILARFHDPPKGL